MDERNFVASEFGQPARQPGVDSAFTYYRPLPIPRTIELQPRTQSALSDADVALGKLEGLGLLVPNPDLLIGPYLFSEAVASTRIEGTQASMTEVLRASVIQDVSGERSDDIDEVMSYIEASDHAYERLQELPLTQRLLKEAHAKLLANARGAERMPGQFRASPVWVGPRGATPDSAVFVPPLHDEISDLIRDWEYFVNDPPEMPLLVRVAMAHYQLETIHPFLDGNGRLGRLVIGLMLRAEGRLSSPLLYISGYLESHRDEYYETLQGVRERADVQAWLQFFFRAVSAQSNDAIGSAQQLIELQRRYSAEAASTRSRLGVLVDVMMRNPFVTAHRLQAAAEITNAGAHNILREAQRRGWISLAGTAGQGGRKVWVAAEVLAVLESLPAYDPAQ